MDSWSCQGVNEASRLVVLLYGWEELGFSIFCFSTLFKYVHLLISWLNVIWINSWQNTFNKFCVNVLLINSWQNKFTKFWMNVTSGKSGIWPLEALENQGFVKMEKFPRGKKTQALDAFGYRAYGRRHDDSQYVGESISLVVMSIFLSVRKVELLI